MQTKHVSEEEMRKTVDTITKHLVDDGRLVQAGWMAMRHCAMPEDCPETQIKEMRKAFFTGAQHVFASIMGFLDSGAEPTEKDMKRMTALHVELANFVKEMKNEDWT